MSSPGKRKRSSLWGWIFVILLAAGGFAYYQSTQKSKAKVVYETSPITRGAVSARITATGNLQAVTQVTVGSQVSGIIQQLYVDFNSRVHKGQSLAQLDPSTFRAQLEQTTASVNNALANLGNQQANVANMEANIRSAESAISSAEAKVESAIANQANSQASVTTARANVRKAQADLQLATRNKQRQQTLKQRDLIASSDLDTAVTTELTTRATLESLQSQIVAAEANLRSSQANVRAAVSDVAAARTRRDAAIQQKESARAQVRGAQAQVSQAQANQHQSEVNLSYTTIKSSIDGIVLDRKVEVGQTVAAQFQAPDLFTIAENLEQIKVQTSVDEADIGQVKVGQEANFTVDSYPNDRFKGKVSEVRQAPVTLQNVVTYTVIIRTTNPDGKLKPGMTATVSILTDSRTDALLVPNGALRFKPADQTSGGRTGASKDKDSKDKGAGDKEKSGKERGGRGEGRRMVTVWTQDPADSTKLVTHRLRPGISDGINTEILKSDLKEGDAVVTGTAGDSPNGGKSSSGGGGSKSRGGMRMF